MWTVSIVQWKFFSYFWNSLYVIMYDVLELTVNYNSSYLWRTPGNYMLVFESNEDKNFKPTNLYGTYNLFIIIYIICLIELIELIFLLLIELSSSPPFPRRFWFLEFVLLYEAPKSFKLIHLSFLGTSYDWKS